MQGLSTRIAAPIEFVPIEPETDETFGIAWLDSAEDPGTLPRVDQSFWIWVLSTFNCHVESDNYPVSPLGDGLHINPYVTTRLGPFRRESLGTPPDDPDWSTGFVLYLTSDDTLPAGGVYAMLQVIESEGQK